MANAAEDMVPPHHVHVHVHVLLGAQSLARSRLPKALTSPAHHPLPLPHPSPCFPFKLCNFIFASYYVARLLSTSSSVSLPQMPGPPPAFVIASCRRLALLQSTLAPLLRCCVSFAVALLPPCHHLSARTCLYVHGPLGPERTQPRK